MAKSTKADEVFRKYYWIPEPMIFAYLFDKGEINYESDYGI